MDKPGISQTSNIILSVLLKTSSTMVNLCEIFYDLHCVKNVLIWSYSSPQFPAFGLNTERYPVSLHIQPESRKIRTRIAPNTDIYAVLMF